MFFVLLRPFFFCGLEVERLTLAATFFFILLFPCGQYRTSGLPRLWKLGISLPWQLSCQGEAGPFIRQKLWMRQLHQEWGKFRVLSRAAAREPYSLTYSFGAHAPTTFSRKMSARAFALRRYGSSRVLSLRSRQAKKGSVHRFG